MMKEVPDPRCKRKKAHDCAEILTYIVMGYVCGRTALRRALSWARSHEEELRRSMKLSGGIASVSTISRLLSSIDEEIFALTFTDWVSQLLKKMGLHIIIDGKALRASAKKIENGNIPYTLNAIDAATEMVIAQLPIGLKTNEITAIPRLIDIIDVEDNLVTIDAIGTQTAIMEQLDNRGAGFVLQVKKNQPQMYEDICSYIDYISEQKEKIKNDPSYRSTLEKFDEADIFESNEKNRERHEYRTVTVSGNISCLSKHEEMAYIKTVGISCQTRILIVRDSEGNDITPALNEFLKGGSNRQPSPVIGDGISDSVQKVGIVSNRKMNAQEVANIKRNHWRIENGLHHVLDDAFREDRSPAKRSKNNLALIRKIAYNIIRYAPLYTGIKSGVIAMMDYFADNTKELAKYIFEPLKPISEIP